MRFAVLILTLPLSAQTALDQTQIKGHPCSLRTEGRLLSVFARATPRNPCVVSIGDVDLMFTGPVEATLQNPAPGSVYVSVFSGMVTLSHSAGLVIECPACRLMPGMESFPPGSRHIGTVDVAAGIGNVRTELYGALPVCPELSNLGGIQISPAGEKIGISIDSALHGERVAAPATVNSKCSIGQWAVSSTHAYYCVSPDNWGRVRLEAW